MLIFCPPKGHKAVRHFFSNSNQMQKASFDHFRKRTFRTGYWLNFTRSRDFKVGKAILVDPPGLRGLMDIIS